MAPDPKREYAPVERMTWEEDDISMYITWGLAGILHCPNIRHCRMWRHNPTRNYFVEVAVPGSDHENLEEAIDYIERIVYGNSGDARARLRSVYSDITTRDMTMLIDISWPEKTLDISRRIYNILPEIPEEFSIKGPVH